MSLLHVIQCANSELVQNCSHLARRAGIRAFCAPWPPSPPLSSFSSPLFSPFPPGPSRWLRAWPPRPPRGRTAELLPLQSRAVRGAVDGSLPPARILRKTMSSTAGNKTAQDSMDEIKAVPERRSQGTSSPSLLVSYFEASDEVQGEGLGTTQVEGVDRRGVRGRDPRRTSWSGALNVAETSVGHALRGGC